MKEKNSKGICHVNTNQKKIGMNIVIIDEVDFRAKKITRETLYDRIVNTTRRDSSAKYI